MFPCVFLLLYVFWQQNPRKHHDTKKTWWRNYVHGDIQKKQDTTLGPKFEKIQKIHLFGIWTYQGIEQIMRKRNPMPVWPNSFQNDTFLMKYWKKTENLHATFVSQVIQKIKNSPPEGSCSAGVYVFFVKKSKKCNSF